MVLMRSVKLRINLTQKFMAFLLLAAILPLIIVGVSAYQVSRTIVHEEAIRFTQALVDSQSDYLDLQSQQIGSLIANLVSVEAITEALANDVQTDAYTNLATQARIGYILDGYSNLQGLVSIDIFTMRGTHYHVGDTLDVSRLRTDVIARLFLDARTYSPNVVWEGIEHNVNASSTQLHVITAARMIMNTTRGSATSEPVGMLLVNSSVDELHTHFDHGNLGEGASFLIIDAQGRIMYHPDSRLLGTTIHRTIRDALQGTRGTVTQEIDGQTMLLTYTTSSLSGWTILSLVPVAILDSRASSVGQTVFAALAVACIIVGLVATFASQQIVIPLRDLTRHLQLLPTNKPGWDEPLLVRGTDEVADLNRWFNTFLETLSARSRAEESLRESENRYALAMQGTNDGIWDWDLRTGLVHYSARWKAILGYAEDTTDTSIDAWLDHVHPDDIANVHQHLNAHLQGTTALFESEHRIRRQNNDTYLWVLARGMIITDEQHRPIRIAGSLTDISNRKQAEEALRESEEQTRLLFEESPDAVILFDNAGRVTRMNRAFEQLTGYPAEQITGHTLKDMGLVSSEQFVDMSSGNIKSSSVSDQLITAEFRLATAHNETRDVGARMFGLTIRGHRHYLSTMRDITIEKQVEDTLRRANAELARAGRTKDEFLANMSHELRTPLNAVLALSESLQELVMGPLNERQLIALSHVEASGRHLLALINDILDISKVEAGRLDLQFDVVEVADICQSSLVFVKELAIKKSVKLALQLNDPMAEIEVDARRMKQMLVNLLSNAVKFTPTKGQVRLEVTTDTVAGLIHFSVYDTGIGITPDDLPRLFQPFQQLDSSLSRSHEGTGLGLALVRRLAELHGGNVTVKSIPGQGSCFTITLPYHPSQIQEITFPGNARPALLSGMVMKPSVREVEGSTNGVSQVTLQQQDAKRILLTEDNDINIVAMAEYLRAKGYLVTVAHNGREALERASETPPDIILMDIQMPEMDGLEAIRHLRVMPDCATTPIIALTALAMPGDRERCLEAGANEYMTKPVNLKRLLETILRYISPSVKL